MLAVALRLWHIGHGLPDFTEEAFVFRRALDLWGPTGQGGSLNPQSFVYPSLTIYLHLMLQHVWFLASGTNVPADFLLRMLTDPTGPVILSRLLGVVADVVTMLMAGRIAARFGRGGALLAMAIVALSPIMIRTSRLLLTDSVMCALAVAAVERTLAYCERGGRRRLIVAAVLVGLATGAKYGAAMLLVPLTLAVVVREPSARRASSWILAGLAAAVAFLCTTPFLVVEGARFLKDARALGEALTSGWLGVPDSGALAFGLVEAARNLGWGGAALLGISAAVAVREKWRGAAGLLWVAWLVMFVPALAVRIEAPRYLVPAIALGAALAGVGFERLTRGWRASGRAVLAAATLGPLLWSGLGAAAEGRSTTRIEARKWCDASLGPEDMVLAEVGGPMLPALGKKAQVLASPLFGAASPRAQAAYRSSAAWHVAVLPLVVSGRTTIGLPPGRSEWRVYDRIVDWNAAVYDLRLLRGIDYVITSAAVRGRFQADPGRFSEQHTFYEFLERTGERVATFESGRGVAGPKIVIYRITPTARRAVEATGPLDAWWWARTVPVQFKRAATAALDGGATVPAGEIPGIPAWAQPLRIAYAERYQTFADDLAENLASLGRMEAAERLCLGSLTIVPEDVWAATVYVEVASRLGHWATLERQLRRSLDVLSRYGPPPEELQAAHRKALSRAGPPIAGGNGAP